MRRQVLNMSFALLFLLIFTLIVTSYSAHFIQAFSGNPPLFPTNKALPIDECQSWTEEVRSFSIADGEQAEQVTVLMYHRIIADDELKSHHYESEQKLYDTIVLKSEFEKQMKLLHDEKYVTLTAKEFQLFMENKLDVPKKSVLITIDDGFKDNFIEAYPILKAYDFKALVFLVTGFLSERNQKYSANQVQYLSLADLKKSCAVFEFQSHSFNFHRRTKEDVAYLLAKSEEEVEYDLTVSLFHLNGNKRSFAYPYGDYDLNTLEILKKLGFEMAFTVEYKVAKPGMNMYEIPRKGVYPEDTIDDFKLKIRLD